MRVFISWSGDRSRAVAELLNEWIQCVLQAIRPWMSSKDIDRGSLWFSEITDQLKDTKIGIICLTRDNLNKPWILFESGALAKGLSNSRVCTFLIDLDATDVGNPLAQFNHTMPDEEGLYELVHTLNSSLGDQRLKEKVLAQVFETYWPQFKADFETALKNNPAGEHAPLRSEESMIAEVLRTIRSMDRRVRSIEQRGKRPGFFKHFTSDATDAIESRYPLKDSLKEKYIMDLAKNYGHLDIDDEVSESIAIQKWIQCEIESLVERGAPPEDIEKALEGKASLEHIRHVIKRAIAQQEE